MRPRRVPKNRKREYPHCRSISPQLIVNEWPVTTSNHSNPLHPADQLAAWYTPPRSSVIGCR